MKYKKYWLAMLCFATINALADDGQVYASQVHLWNNSPAVLSSAVSNPKNVTFTAPLPSSIASYASDVVFASQSVGSGSYQISVGLIGSTTPCIIQVTTGDQYSPYKSKATVSNPGAGFKCQIDKSQFIKIDPQ